jgi:hypothetical protein
MRRFNMNHYICTVESISGEMLSSVFSETVLGPIVSQGWAS